MLFVLLLSLSFLALLWKFSDRVLQAQAVLIFSCFIFHRKWFQYQHRYSSIQLKVFVVPIALLWPWYFPWSVNLEVSFELRVQFSLMLIRTQLFSFSQWGGWLFGCQLLIIVWFLISFRLKGLVTVLRDFVLWWVFPFGTRVRVVFVVGLFWEDTPDIPDQLWVFQQLKVFSTPLLFIRLIELFWIFWFPTKQPLRHISLIVGDPLRL